MTKQITPPVPRLLDSGLAAAYLGLSNRAFEIHWKMGRIPAPHRLGRRVLWDRLLLDQFVDQLSGLAPEPEPPKTKRKFVE